MDRPRAPEDITPLAVQEGPAVEVAPHKEPETPLEWVRENLFSSWFSGILTLISTAFLLYFGYAFLHWIFVSAEWRVVKVNLRSWMLGRFPPEGVGRVVTSMFLVVALSGLTWGGLGKRIRWTIGRRIMAAGFAVGGLLLLYYVLSGVGIWLLIGGLTGTFAAAVWLGKRLGFRLRGVITFGWVLIYPVVVAILVAFGGPSPARWGGFLLNVMVGSAGIVLSFPIGVVLALGRRSSFPAIRTFCVGFIELLRGVPLITLLFAGLYFLPLLLPPSLDLHLIIRITIMFTIFSGVYVAEIIRGGLQGVHQGQYEAARALGLPTWRMTALVILPQALRNTIPALVSHFISVWKDTSLVGLVGSLDEGLSQARHSAAGLEFIGTLPEVLFGAGFIFWVVAISLGRWSQRVEKRVGVGER